MVPLSGMGRGQLALVGAGMAVVVGAIHYMSTRTDGSRYVTRRYGPDFRESPMSRAAARDSIASQRSMATVATVLGAAGLGVGLLAGGKLMVAIPIGGAALGLGAGRLLKLNGAEDGIAELDLPEQTTDGLAVRRTYFDIFGRVSGEGYGSGDGYGSGTGFGRYGYGLGRRTLHPLPVHTAAVPSGITTPGGMQLLSNAIVPDAPSPPSGSVPSLTERVAAAPPG